MNNRGQTVALGFIAALMLFIVGSMTIDFFKDDITLARTNLDCASPGDISDGVKLTCLVIDIVIPYFFLIILSISVGVLIARFMR